MTLRGFRLEMEDLPEGVTVQNGASGGGAVVYTPHLEPGAEVELTIEFFDPARRPASFQPDYLAAVLKVVSPVVSQPNGAQVEVERSLMRGDGSMLIEWKSVPGRSYRVEYSADLAEWWTVNQDLTAGADRMQWVDHGPPKTPSHPRNANARYYRVVESLPPAVKTAVAR